MNLHAPTLSAKLSAHCLLLATLAIAGIAGPAQALTPSEAKAVQTRFQQERSHCLDGSSNQDRGTCLREAGAARDEALKKTLGDSSAAYADNQRQRCAALPGDDQRDCLARMQGQGSTSGSVAAGGLLRALVTTVPAASAPVAAPPSR